MSELKIFLLGPPRLERNGQIVEPDTRKATALLALLALEGGFTRTREGVAAFLWPDFDDSRARAALRRTLSALKKTIGEEYLTVSRELISLNAERVWCDVTAFLAYLAQAATSENGELNHLKDALELYRGDLMSGFSLRDSIPFDDWQLQHGEQLRRDAGRAAAQLVAGLIDARQFDDGAAYAGRWLQLDPLNEEGHRQLLRLLAWTGQRGAALLHYRRLVRLLDEELGVPPLPETIELYQSIQSNVVPEAAPSGQPKLPAPGESAPPFIGRAAERRRLHEMYAAVGPTARLAVIEGEPGIGKTRLAEAFVSELPEAPAVWTRCYEGEFNLAYAPLIQALEFGLDRADPSRLKTLAPHHLAEAARLMPALAVDRILPAPPPLDAPGAQVRFFEGIANLLMTLLHGGRPGIVLIDDAHWLEPATLEFLLYWLHRWEKWPLLILLCWRRENLAADFPLLPLLKSLRLKGAADLIRPARFSEAEVNALIEVAHYPRSKEIKRRLFEESEGLPAFAVEYLNALPETPEPVPGPLPTPHSVRDILQNRLDRLQPAEKQILQAAAVIGHGFDVSLVQVVSGRTFDEIANGLEQLVAQGLVAERGLATDYDFTHDKLRSLVYDEMGLARRRLLHRRLADALAARPGNRTAAEAAQLAGHYRGAGQDESATEWFEQAGRLAEHAFAYREAVHYFQTALALGAAEPWRLHGRCGDLLTRLGDYSAALLSLEKAAALAPTVETAVFEQKIAQVYMRQGEWPLAGAMLDQAQTHLEQNAGSAVKAQLLVDRSFVAHRQNRSDEAHALAAAARTLAETTDNAESLARIYNLLGLLAHSRDAIEEAIDWLERSRSRAAACGRADIEIAARNNLARALTAIGRLVEAEAQLAYALDLVKGWGDYHHEAALRSNLGDVLHKAGKEDEAREQVRQSAALMAEIGREQGEWRPEIWRLTEW